MTALKMTFERLRDQLRADGGFGIGVNQAIKALVEEVDRIRASLPNPENASPE